MSRTHVRDIEPLLKDLSEKKQSFRTNFASLTAELKELRSHHASKEQTYANEILSGKERNGKLSSSNFAADKYTMELEGLRSQLSITQASAASAESAQLQCIALLEELHEKNGSLKEQEIRLQRLEAQFESLRKGFEMRDFSQKQLKEEVVRVEHDIARALAKVEASKERELRRIMLEESGTSLLKMNKVLTSKDEEIKGLKDEMKALSKRWRFKTKELESKLLKQRKTDQELKRRVLKLELCVQEAQSRTTRLQRVGHRSDKTIIKEVRDQIAAKQQDEATVSAEKPTFWERSNFKLLVSMSMVIVVVFLKR